MNKIILEIHTIQKKLMLDLKCEYINVDSNCLMTYSIKWMLFTCDGYNLNSMSKNSVRDDRILVNIKLYSKYTINMCYSTLSDYLNL